VLKNYFGGSSFVTTAADTQHMGNFELGNYNYEVGSQESDDDLPSTNDDNDHHSPMR